MVPIMQHMNAALWQSMATIPYEHSNTWLLSYLSEELQTSSLHLLLLPLAHHKQFRLTCLGTGIHQMHQETQRTQVGIFIGKIKTLVMRFFTLTWRSSNDIFAPPSTFLSLNSENSHHFPAKPLRDSQSHLLTDSQSWTETSASIENNKSGKRLLWGFLSCDVFRVTCLQA